MLNDPVISLAIDAALAALLIVAIIASFRLYKHLETIRKGQSEMAGLVKALNNAVLDAQRSIAELKYLAKDVEEKLDGEVRKAKSLRDELSLITEAGNNLADRIERGVSNVRKESVAAAEAGPRPVEAKQKELLSALKEAR